MQSPHRYERELSANTCAEIFDAMLFGLAAGVIAALLLGGLYVCLA
jgi:hypothetical protein